MRLTLRPPRTAWVRRPPRSSTDGRLLHPRDHRHCFCVRCRNRETRVADARGDASIRLTARPCLPSVRANLVIVHPGNHGPLTAFDANTGAVRWAGADRGAYASPMIVELGGVRQVVTMTQESVLGVSLVRWRAALGVSVAVPLDAERHHADPVRRDADRQQPGHGRDRAEADQSAATSGSSTSCGRPRMSRCF